MVSLLLQPETIDEAASALTEHGSDARIIAGGTAVVLMLQHRLITPEVLVSLGRIPSLDRIEVDPDGAVHLGALATLTAAERSSIIRERLPVLSATYRQVANVRIRNAATVGGNVIEADYASDPPAVLVALRARAQVTSAREQREIPLTDLFTGFYETSLESDELLAEIIIPPLSRSACATYLKFTSRSTEDRPCVGVCAILERDMNNRCTDLRVVVGAVDEIPREVSGAEDLARGERMSPELSREIAERYAAEIEPLSDLRGSTWYRKEMIRVFVRRALEQVSSV